MKIVFICTGNTCRSPMAEGYLKSFNLKNFEVLSRGLCADGQAASENSVLAMKEVGIDISGHISKPLSKDDLNSDLFVVMSRSHKDALLSLLVDEEKIIVLSGGVSDPFGLPLQSYKLCRDEIFSGIDNLLFCGILFPFSVREAKLDDIKALCSLEKECFSSPWSENAIKESMDAGTEFFLCESDGEIFGYGGFSPVADEGYITNIAVSTEHRNKGVGSLLVAKILARSRKLRLSFVSLEVRRSNFAAQKIYLRFGFSVVGERKDFYTLPNENALIMTNYFKR